MITPLIQSSKLMGEKIGIEPILQESRNKKKKKKTPEEKASDESHSFDSTTQLRVRLLQVLDTIITQMEGRLVALKEVAYDFGFLNGVSIKTTTLDELKNQATDLALKYPADLNAYEFTSEIESFKCQDGLENIPKHPSDNCYVQTFVQQT
ncbi:unnamed protein product [Psylliodes chrysocephalus]|uniref:Uncharacterized protein n=1 Tax=Psylliodes chrysocephalus TaxID=3402493 RepID=A0A9P0GIG2_9CUCU|nr:unnamed protein product [Psylliodes chrysocephala]